MKFILLFFINFSLFAFELQKATIYNENINFKENWYMSEKLDGIRAYWNGKELFTKNGNKIFAPTWFTKDFPNFQLDGELWSKKEDFENIQNIVLDKNPSSKWQQITHNIFEVPNENGDFKKRLEKIENWLKINPNSYIKIIPQIICKDKTHLNNFLNEMLKNKAEGVMLKNPNKEYKNLNANDLLKIKTFFDDEAIVIGHNIKDEKLKSLILKMKNGIIFNLGGGFSNEERITPPKIGETITFKYYGFTKNGKPKFASFLRIRKKE